MAVKNCQFGRFGFINARIACFVQRVNKDLIRPTCSYELNRGMLFGRFALRGQTVHSLHCERNKQQAKIRFVAESATLLLFFDLLCCCTAQNCSKNKQICGIRNCICGIQNSLLNPQINDKTIASLN